MNPYDDGYWIEAPPYIVATFNKVVDDAVAKGAILDSARQAMIGVWKAEKHLRVKSFIYESRTDSGDAFYMAKMTEQKTNKKSRWKVELEVKKV